MTAAAERPNRAAARSVAFNVLIGLTTLAILLQGVWAGIFLSYDKRPDRWVNVHAHGADVAIGLCALALVAALIQLRSRRDLVIGTVALLVLLVVEAFLGGRIT
jgi:hypothetical protein